jgi:hypothetical protein
VQKDTVDKEELYHSAFLILRPVVAKMFSLLDFRNRLIATFTEGVIAHGSIDVDHQRPASRRDLPHAQLSVNFGASFRPYCFY